MGFEATLQEKLDLAVRVGLAIVTEGVTIAPLQGISEVKIKKNSDGSEYLSISFAGPIRSAGGTEAASTMLIADHVRKIAGLAKAAVCVNPLQIGENANVPIGAGPNAIDEIGPGKMEAFLGNFW